MPTISPSTHRDFATTTTDCLEGLSTIVCAWNLPGSGAAIPTGRHSREPGPGAEAPWPTLPPGCWPIAPRRSPPPVLVLEILPGRYPRLLPWWTSGPLAWTIWPPGTGVDH